jgi:hypothetical protein
MSAYACQPQAKKTALAITIDQCGCTLWSYAVVRIEAVPILADP